MHENQIIKRKTDEVMKELNVTKGETEIFGTLISVGGEEPILEIQQVKEESFKCKVSKEIAAKISPSLYKKIGLRGIASWNRRDLTLVHFEVTDCKEIDENTLIDIRKEVGHEIKTEEMIEYVQKLREEDEWR